MLFIGTFKDPQGKFTLVQQNKNMRKMRTNKKYESIKAKQ